jgi:uncharacterized membrane protein
MEQSKLKTGPEAGQKPSRVATVELAVSKMLRIGIFVAAGVIVLGLLWLLVTGQGGYPQDTYPSTFQGIISGLADWKPIAVIEAGLLLLILIISFALGKAG